MRIILGVFLAVPSLLILGIEIMAILDPVGIQMANDNDPFGEPPGIGAHIFQLCFSGVCALLAYILLKKQSRTNKGEI